MVNSWQKMVIILGALIALGLIFYPPWFAFAKNDTGQFTRVEFGHYWIWSPPSIDGKPVPDRRIASSQLSQSLFLLIGIGLVAYIAAAKVKPGPGNGT